MGSNNINGKVVVSAVITRADGTVEDLGVISELSAESADKIVKVLEKSTEHIGTLSEDIDKE